MGFHSAACCSLSIIAHERQLCTSFLNSVFTDAHLLLKIDHSERIFTMEISKYCKLQPAHPPPSPRVSCYAFNSTSLFPFPTTAHSRAAPARPAPGPAKGDAYGRPGGWAWAAGVGLERRRGGPGVRARAAQ